MNEMIVQVLEGIIKDFQRRESNPKYIPYCADGTPMVEIFCLAVILSYEEAYELYRIYPPEAHVNVNRNLLS